MENISQSIPWQWNIRQSFSSPSPFLVESIGHIIFIVFEWPSLNLQRCSTMQQAWQHETKSSSWNGECTSNSGVLSASMTLQCIWQWPMQTKDKRCKDQQTTTGNKWRGMLASAMPCHSEVSSDRCLLSGNWKELNFLQDITVDQHQHYVMTPPCSVAGRWQLLTVTANDTRKNVMSNKQPPAKVEASAVPWWSAVSSDRQGATQSGM